MCRLGLDLRFVNFRRPGGAIDATLRSGYEWNTLAREAQSRRGAAASTASVSCPDLARHLALRNHRSMSMTGATADDFLAISPRIRVMPDHPRLG